MSETYTAMEQRFEEEVSSLDLMFAFSNEQFKEVMEQHGWTIDNHPQFFNIGIDGGFATKENAKKLTDTLKRQHDELTAAMQNDDFAIQAFKYEASNHEYLINDYGDEETLSALDLTTDDLDNDPRLHKLYKKAILEYSKEALA